MTGSFDSGENHHSNDDVSGEIIINYLNKFDIHYF